MDEDKLKPDVELDLSGLSCPLPVLKTKKALASMESGMKIQVITTDNGSYEDFEYFCTHAGHILIKREKQMENFKFLIQCK
mgnify:CR=1 FL=1